MGQKYKTNRTRRDARTTQSMNTKRALKHFFAAADLVFFFPFCGGSRLNEPARLVLKPANKPAEAVLLWEKNTVLANKLTD